MKEETQMPTSIYAMRENILALKGEVDSLSEWLADNASNPKTPLDDIRAKQTKLAEINERHEIACKELKRVEDGQKAALLEQERSNPTDAQASEIKLRAAFIRAAARGETEKARSIAAKLGAIPAGDSDLGGGESFLPANISRELISEPLDENPLRQVVPVTNITGLVLPRIAYTVDDDDFVTDEEVAKEMALSGDSVSFGRFKTKVEAKISDTVMYGTDADLVSYVQNALQSGLASKEKKQLFSQNYSAAENTLKLVNWLLKTLGA
jgi:HK97 family phage major capsid protein